MSSTANIDLSKSVDMSSPIVLYEAVEDNGAWVSWKKWKKKERDGQTILQKKDKKKEKGWASGVSWKERRAGEAYKDNN